LAALEAYATKTRAMVVELSTKFSTSSQSAPVSNSRTRSRRSKCRLEPPRVRKLWKRSGPPPPLLLLSNGHDADDKEFTAMVALQSAGSWARNTYAQACKSVGAGKSPHALRLRTQRRKANA
jgi:hypothetical protein